MPDVSNSGMVALIPSDDDARALAVDGGDPADDLHLTLAYLGDNVADDIDDDQLDALHDLLEASARTQPPLQARVMAHAAFNPDGGPDGDREPCAVHLVGDSTDIGPLREWLIRTLQDGDAYATPPQQHDPFIPHVTGGYGLDPADLSHTGPVTFDRMRLALGGQQWDFPLAGAPDPVLEAKSAQTHKPPQSVVSNAKRALDMISDGKAGSNFTSAGRTRATQLASGNGVSYNVVKRMYSYLSRHDKGDQGKQNEQGTPANVAFLAWGGKAGLAWSRGIVGEQKSAWALPLEVYGVAHVEVKNRVATQEGANRYGVPVGTELGQARDAREQQAQADPRARQLYDEGVNSPTSDKMAVKVEALNDRDLEALTRTAFSFRGTNPKVVELRVALANALAKRGKDVKDFGARGGGKPRPGERGQASTAPTSDPAASLPPRRGESREQTIARRRQAGDDNADGRMDEDESGWDAGRMGNRRGVGRDGKYVDNSGGQQPVDPGIDPATGAPYGYPSSAVVGSRSSSGSGKRSSTGKGKGRGKAEKPDPTKSPEAERGRAAGRAAAAAAGVKSDGPVDLERKAASVRTRTDGKPSNDPSSTTKFPESDWKKAPPKGMKCSRHQHGDDPPDAVAYREVNGQRFGACAMHKREMTEGKSMGADVETKVASPNPKAAKLRRWWAFNPEGRKKWRPGTPGDFKRLRRHLAKYVKAPHVLDGLTANIHKLATGSWPGKGRGHGTKGVFDYVALEWKAIPLERRDEVDDAATDASGGDEDAQRRFADLVGDLPSAEREDGAPEIDDTAEPVNGEVDGEVDDPDDGIETEDLDDDAKSLADDVPDEEALTADLSPDDFPDDDEIQAWMGDGGDEHPDGAAGADREGPSGTAGGGEERAGAQSEDDGEDTADPHERPGREEKALAPALTPLAVRDGRNHAIGATMRTTIEEQAVADDHGVVAPDEDWQTVVGADVDWQPQGDGSIAPVRSDATGAGGFDSLFDTAAAGPGGAPAGPPPSLWD